MANRYHMWAALLPILLVGTVARRLPLSRIPDGCSRVLVGLGGADSVGVREDNALRRLTALLDLHDYTGLAELVRTGVSPDVGCLGRGGSGDSCLRWAIRNRRWHAVPFLLDLGADVRAAFPSDYSNNDCTDSGVEMQMFATRVVSQVAFPEPDELEALHALGRDLRRRLHERRNWIAPDLLLAIEVLAGDPGRARGAAMLGGRPTRDLCTEGDLRLCGNAMTLADSLRMYDLVEFFASGMRPGLALRFPDRWNALSRASARGDADRVLYLLSRSDVPAEASSALTRGGRDRLSMALYCASLHGHVEVLELLVDAGADLDECQIDGNTALVAATMGNSRPAVEFLLSRGARPVVNGTSCIDRAIWSNKWRVVPPLVAAMGGWAEISYGGSFPGIVGNVPMDLLSCAAARGHLQVVDSLLAMGFPVDGVHGVTEVRPIQWAAQSGHTAVVLRFLEAGCDRTALLRPGPDGRNAQDLACMNGFLDIVEIIETL